MGNRLCKKKDVVDDVGKTKEEKTKFDRIISRLHLKPASWKSETQLMTKNRSKSEERKADSTFYTSKPISKSSDWTNVELDDDHVHLTSPKVNLIFDNGNNGTPTPPPRKTIRDRVEKIAAKAFQHKKKDVNVVAAAAPEMVPVEEPLMVKKKINYNCPICDSDEKDHNRDHHHHPQHNKKSDKREKNLSVISLPNYNDLKLSVVPAKTPVNSSRLSLQQQQTKNNGKLDSYITRCRSFGSIFPQQLKKLKTPKTAPEDITSDDSFGPLEDWDVGLIEHYNPKDASLPRPRRPQKDVIKGIEDLIVQDIEPPSRPLRRSESLQKKDIENPPKAEEEVVCLTPPPSPLHQERVTKLRSNFEAPKDVSKRESVSEHSSLMKILQEFSIKDVQTKEEPSLEEFLNEEKKHSTLLY